MNCWGLNGWREGNTANQDLKKVYNESITCPILLRMGWEWMNEKESIKEERKEGRKEKENGGLLENKETWKGRKKRKREASVWFSHSRNSCKEVELFYCWGVYSVVVIYLGLFRHCCFTFFSIFREVIEISEEIHGFAKSIDGHQVLEGQFIRRTCREKINKTELFTI